MSDPLKLGGNPLVPDDSFVRQTVRAALHLRRHLPLYAIGVAVILAAVLVPTVAFPGGSGGGPTAAGRGYHGSGSTGGATSGGGSPNGSAGPGGAAAGASSGGLGSGGSVSAAGSIGGGGAGGGTSTGNGGSQSASGGTNGQSIGTVSVGQGVTVGGFKCTPGVRQIPWSSYAAPCQAAYQGFNGGATYRGVTGSTILIADRDCPQSADSQAVDEFAQQAGAASPNVSQQVAQTFIDYFNKVFDLYGRHVVFKPVQVGGSSLQCTYEAEDQGQSQACADADGIANTMHAFGEDGLGIYSQGAGGGGSGPFSECAAQQHLVEFNGGAYYPESWYDQLNPYVWNPIMGCQRIAYEVGEALSKEIMGHDAKWAGDPLLQHTKRVLGIYVPNNPGYQECATEIQDYLKSHGYNPGYRFNYVLDVSRFADQASQAVVQFHAEGVTTVVLACDPISPVFLTEEADAQHYYPEWYNIGVALNDFDTVPRLWDAKEITGHLFGLSQLGPSQAAVGPASEPGITYQHITGKTIPMGTSGDYYQLLEMFSQLQAAGPILTPQTLAKGTYGLPPGGAPVPGGTSFAYPVGYACFCTSYTGGPGVDHTAVEDSREIYWDNDGTSPYDGKQGTYIQIWSGARFRVGQFPTGSPPFYPPQCDPECTTPPPNEPPPPGPHDGG